VTEWIRDHTGANAIVVT